MNQQQDSANSNNYNVGAFQKINNIFKKKRNNKQYTNDQNCDDAHQVPLVFDKFSNQIEIQKKEARGLKLKLNG